MAILFIKLRSEVFFFKPHALWRCAPPAWILSLPAHKVDRGEVDAELGRSSGGENYAFRLERSAGLAESASLSDLFGTVCALTGVQHSSDMFRGLYMAPLSQIRVAEVDHLGSGGVCFS